MLKVYLYRGCTTCKKAIKFLNHHEVAYEEVGIVTNPPSLLELQAALKNGVDGQVKKLFNTSGEVYRNLELKAKLPAMNEEEALKLLSQHGKLIKRPLVIGEVSLVGFREDEWKEKLL
ncbi:MAG: Spx/MgsR family RNA polymerase-binding regulatory protein [Oligoflexales bacterium]